MASPTTDGATTDDLGGSRGRAFRGGEIDPTVPAVCMDLVNDYAWFRSREPWAKGMVVGTKEQERARHGAQPPPDRLLCPAGSEVPWGSLAVLGDCPAGRSAFSLRESWDLCTCPSPHDWRGNCANFDCG